MQKTDILLSGIALAAASELRRQSSPAAPDIEQSAGTVLEKVAELARLKISGNLFPAPLMPHSGDAFSLGITKYENAGNGRFFLMAGLYGRSGDINFLYEKCAALSGALPYRPEFSVPEGGLLQIEFAEAWSFSPLHESFNSKFQAAALLKALF